MSKLLKHRSEAQEFTPAPAASAPPTVLQDDMKGKPELLSTLLPSDYPSSFLESIKDSRICETERELRWANCLRALQSIRAFTIQRAHILRSHLKHARGIKAFTRAHAYAKRIADQQKSARWAYSHSRERLLRLGMNAQDQKTFLQLKDSDLRELNNFKADRRELGDGRIRLPSYWRVGLAEERDALTTVSTRGQARLEYDNSECAQPGPNI